MNKKRAGELVRHGGFMDDEAYARAVNARAVGPATWHAEAAVSRVPLLVRRSYRDRASVHTPPRHGAIFARNPLLMD